jgi:hypothetical protein
VAGFTAAIPIQSMIPRDFQDLEAIVTEKPIEIRPEETVLFLDADDVIDTAERIAELGIWLSGVRSYLAMRPRLAPGGDATAWEQLAATEFKVLHEGVKHCAMISSLILSDKEGVAELSRSAGGALSSADLVSLHEVLNEAVLVGESFVNSAVQGPGQWSAWSAMFSRRLGETRGYYEAVHFAEMTGARFLPSKMRNIPADPAKLTPELAELILVLPRFGMVLKWLSVVKKMLDADVPLKPSLLIFARVNELIRDLNSYIGNRLDRFPNQEAELFGTLDAASYTAAIELKKVYSQELAGVAAMRPPPSIFARIETAYSLLNDGFQQILAGFMKIIDPKAEIFDLFPEFQIKLQQSIVLRSELWTASQMVKDAESDRQPAKIEKMRQSLIQFKNGPMRYLFYKDTETVERFIDEIPVTNQNKDLIPILHRFGAFLETLFSQVALRAVLEKHPFERPGE